MASGYVAGGNTMFFGETEGLRDPATWASAIVGSMTKRLSFADDASGEYESMIAFVAPWGDGAKRDQVISLSERLLPWEVTNSGESFADKKQYFPGGSSGFGWYNQQLNLAQIHFGEDIRAAENMEFIAQGAINNATCFLGPHRIFSPWSQTFFELVPGQGHFGPDALPGDARWRRGEAVSLEASRNSMVSIEAAAQSQLVFTRNN